MPNCAATPPDKLYWCSMNLGRKADSPVIANESMDCPIETQRNVALDIRSTRYLGSLSKENFFEDFVGLNSSASFSTKLKNDAKNLDWISLYIMYNQVIKTTITAL